jgi:hypothetical protein
MQMARRQSEVLLLSIRALLWAAAREWQGRGWLAGARQVLSYPGEDLAPSSTCCNAIRRLVVWTTCALSGAPLVPPILADPLGRLVNKEPLLELLLARKGVFADEAARHR